jgi:hypothetical protein
MIDSSTATRRDFVTAVTGVFLALLGVPRAGAARRCSHGPARQGPHPDPRPDVDASHVLTAAELQDVPDVIPIYDGIRKIPHIADGIRCQCGCADIPGYRSLLTCYESEGMAKWCEICQTEGRMVARLHQAGRTLDQIRAAIDARFG